MAYLVLARKWRPLSFADLVGQGHIAQTLSRAIETKRVGHAYLFTGTRGVGKTTTARLLAMALNCEKGPTATPCGKCSVCREIQAGTGLDVLEIDGASNNGVDAVRELREKVVYLPTGGKYRIVIIDEVHMLSTPAFNALLKTLEEPPPNFVFIFATTEPQKVPDTILSRVQRYDFRRVGLADTVERLREICRAESLNFDEAALPVIARRAAGSMRDALTLLDQVLPACEGKLTAPAVRAVLGLVDEEVYLSLFDLVLAKNEAGLMGAVADVFGRGYDLSEFALGLEEHARNLLLTALPGLSGDILSLTPEGFEKLKTQAAKFKKLDLLRMLELLTSLAFRVSRSPLPRFEMEAALLKLANMTSAVDIGKLLQSLDAPPAGGGASQTAYVPPMAPSNPPAPSPRPAASAVSVSAPSKPAPAPAPAAASAAPADVSQIVDQWADIVSRLAAEHFQLGTYLPNSTVVTATAGKIVVGLPPGHTFHHSQLIKPENLAPLKSFLLRHFGFKGDLSFQLAGAKSSAPLPPAAVPAQPAKPIAQTGPASPKLSPAAGKAAPIDEAIAKEPILGSVLDIFNGEVQ